MKVKGKKERCMLPVLIRLFQSELRRVAGLTARRHCQRDVFDACQLTGQAHNSFLLTFE
jgi:hypothetical protein